ncbi:TonB-dependent receptor plug domain-containing protein [Methylorubrum sp. GM97]|uniref:TonB-dependent receptor plug domain-containing protein n=1 Tax=Methylorubrum sp. GM97 TaxID=2938232 RepID=UPI0021C3C897
MSELSVTGTGERAGGPVVGYRATRSATATRTDTALRDTPQSIQVVPREVLVDQQNVRLTDALTNVSNVQPGAPSRAAPTPTSCAASAPRPTPSTGWC